MERLAGLLPGIARWCHTALYGLPNEVVEVRSLPTTNVDWAGLLMNMWCRCLWVCGRWLDSQRLFMLNLGRGFKIG